LNPMSKAAIFPKRRQKNEKTPGAREIPILWRRAICCGSQRAGENRPAAA